ncbi:MAG: signal peptidase I [Paenisporosarcina sp.]
MTNKLTNLRAAMDNTVFKGQKFTDESKRNVRNRISKKHIRINLIPNFLTLTIAVGFLGFGAYFMGEELNLFNQGNPNTTLSKETQEIETITDVNTKQEVETVEPPENSILIEWTSDNMDRGNHDYDSLTHSNLVVGLDYSSIERGDVIYFKSPSFRIESNPEFKMTDYYIARVVGLPGETVEMKSGQVYIDDKKLEAFYAQTLKTGMDEEEYFKRVDPVNRGNEEDDKDYFATTTDPVKVVENTVYVLVDNGSRGVDSRYFGVLSIEGIVGNVLGYSK